MRSIPVAIMDPRNSRSGASVQDPSPYVAGESGPQGLGALSPEAEREAVDRAREGDQDALGVLYDAYLPRLYRYCLTRVGNETDAEDLAEEIFLKVLGAIEGVEWQPVD